MAMNYLTAEIGNKNQEDSGINLCELLGHSVTAAVKNGNML